MWLADEPDPLHPAHGRRSLLEALSVLSSEPGATRVQRLLDDMLDQWRVLNARIKAPDDEFAEMARKDPAPRRLATIPEIGVLNATALYQRPSVLTRWRFPSRC